MASIRGGGGLNPLSLWAQGAVHGLDEQYPVDLFIQHVTHIS